MSSEVLVALAVAPLLLAGFAGVGGALLEAAGERRKAGDASRSLPIAVALGFAVYSFLGYPLALLAPLPAWVVVTVAALGAALGHGFLRRAAAEVGGALPALARGLRAPLPALLAVASAGALSLAALKWLTPPTEGDALHGYLFSARWLAERGLVYCPINPFCFLMPFNTELVFALSFPFGTDLVAKLLDGLLGLCFLFGVYELARRHVAPFYAFLAAASLGLMPDFFKNWSNLTINISASFVFFSAWSLALRRPERPSPRALFLAAFLVGTACAQKYTFWIWAPLLPILAFYWLRTERRRALRTGAGAALVIFACLVPQLVKGWGWAKNPVAPFAMELFPTENVYRTHSSEAEPLGSLLELPHALFFSSSRWPGPLPILLLIGLPLFAGRREKPPALVLALAVAGAAVGVWVLALGGGALVPRFLLAPVALLLPVATCGLEAAGERFRLTRPIVAVAFVVFFFSLAIWPSRHWRHSWAFILGRESRLEWHTTHAAGRGYPVLQRLAPRLGPERRLLIDASFYNLPSEAVPFMSTEEELASFYRLPDDEKLAYARERRFAFYYSFRFSQETPPWAAELPVYDASTGSGVGYRVYQLAGAAPGGSR